jgi:L-histidine Nalpha-methyltransferase
MDPFMARNPRFIQTFVTDASADTQVARSALLRRQASASPKWLYDRLGSHLFEAITELPEYYPTRTETAIFATHGAQMARCIGTGGALIDLGAGNCVKASRLFPLLEPSRYVAVDISVEFLQTALRRVQRESPQLDVVGVGLDFSQRFELPPGLTGERPVFFYPGSSIGNFTPPEALEFLHGLRQQAQGGGLLIGVDLIKPKPILEAAYADALGVTSAFNLNLLRHLNQRIGTDFDPLQWQHSALYNESQWRVEMHLQARAPLVVRWPGAERAFNTGDTIHTENSCKYTVQGFSAMLREAGFHDPKHWCDPQNWYAVFWAEAC